MIYYNQTAQTFTVPVADYGLLVCFFIISVGLLFLFMLVAFKMRNIADRYRLKYGFDKDIERKEMDNPTDAKLNRKEEIFRRRTFKD